MKQVTVVFLTFYRLQNKSFKGVILLVFTLTFSSSTVFYSFLCKV